MLYINVLQYSEDCEMKKLNIDTAFLVSFGDPSRISELDDSKLVDIYDKKNKAILRSNRDRRLKQETRARRNSDATSILNSCKEEMLARFRRRVK